VSPAGDENAPEPIDTGGAYLIECGVKSYRPYVPDQSYTLA